jgi:hypothetical protein
MKALVAALALFVGINAQARSMQVSVEHTLPVVTIDGQASGLVGVVKVDLLSQEISLQLFDDICGSLTAAPGQVHCMAMPILRHEYTVPLKKRQSDGCGTAYYTGKKDLRPVDGNLTEISVEDNNYRTCENVLLNLVAVEVLSTTAGMGGPARLKVIHASTDQAF